MQNFCRESRCRPSCWFGLQPHHSRGDIKSLSRVAASRPQPFFERLAKRKWLNNPEPLEHIEALTRETFKRYRRLDGPPYQLLVSELHRRVLVEYLRAVMRGRIICTSLKMRRRMAGRLRDEGRQIRDLFKDLVSNPERI